MRLSRSSAASLPADIVEAWLELEVGATTVHSEHATLVRGGAVWRALDAIDNVPASTGCVRLAGLRAGKRRVLAELTLDSQTIESLVSAGELDLTIGVGARGVLTCTLDAGGRLPSSDKHPRATSSPLADVQAIVGSEPLLSTLAITLGMAVEAKLADLLTEFFALDSTQTFTSLALQNVAVGLKADALISPFAKPKLPRAPRHLPQRWSVSGMHMLLATPRSHPPRRRSQRQTWHTADDMASAGGSLQLEVPSSQLLITPVTSLRSARRSAESTGEARTGGNDGAEERSAEAGEPLSLSSMKSELVSSARELRRRVAAGAGAEGEPAGGIATFWLPLPSSSPSLSSTASAPPGSPRSPGEALRREGQEGKEEEEEAEASASPPLATAKLPSGEVLTLDEILARSAERAATAGTAAGTQREPLPGAGVPGRAHGAPANYKAAMDETKGSLTSLSSPGPDSSRLLERARRRRRSSIMASGTSDALLAKRVYNAFAAHNSGGAVPSSAGGGNGGSCGGPGGGGEPSGDDACGDAGATCTSAAHERGEEGPADPSTLSLEYFDFLRMCREVLELPHYVAHAVFEELTTLTVSHAVTLSQCEAFFGGFRAEKDEARRVFSALLGPQRALPGETLSRGMYASSADLLSGRDAGGSAGAGGGDGGGGDGGGSLRARTVSAKRLELVVRGVLGLHAGLQFLKGHDEFREAYVETVTTRILFATVGPGRDAIPWSRWRAVEMSGKLFALHDEPDINRAPDFFSYNDFYVIWCLFWELDEDEDGRLSADDLLRYNHFALCPRAVGRVLALSASSTPPASSRAAAGAGAAPAAEPVASAAVGTSATEAHQPDAAEERKGGEHNSSGTGGGDGGASDSSGSASAGGGPRKLTMGFPDFVRFLVAEEVRAGGARLRTIRAALGTWRSPACPCCRVPACASSLAVHPCALLWPRRTRRALPRCATGSPLSTSMATVRSGETTSSTFTRSSTLGARACDHVVHPLNGLLRLLPAAA